MYIDALMFFPVLVLCVLCVISLVFHLLSEFVVGFHLLSEILLLCFVFLSFFLPLVETIHNQYTKSEDKTD